MSPVWKALFVSTESAKAHLWVSDPQHDGLKSLCGKVRVINGLLLEPERADRHHCLSCNDLWVRRNRREIEA